MINDQTVHFNGRTYEVTTGAKQDILRALEAFESTSVPWDYVYPSQVVAPAEQALPEAVEEKAVPAETPQPAAQDAEPTSDNEDDEPTAETPAEPTESGNPVVEDGVEPTSGSDGN